MAENEISDYLETDNDNTDIAGISVQENVMRPPAVNNAFRALQGALKRWFKTSLFRLRDNTDQTKLLAFDLSAFTTAVTRTFAFPNRSGTVALTSDIDVRRNRIVNGDMRVSQENGASSGTTTGFYPVDQWAQYRVTSAGTLTVQQVASVTPAGSPNRLRATVTVADAALAAGEYWTLTQNLEGSNVADFRYGSSAAKNSVLRFGFKGPAGTYAVALHNSGATRSYVALFTIASGEANADTVQTIAIPGDISGTWLTADGVIGITLDIVLACGSTFQGATGWQAGNILGTSAVSNGMGAGSAVFELFDVGLKLDPDATGVYGQYEVGEVHPVFNSERYAESTFNPGVTPASAVGDAGALYFPQTVAASTLVAVASVNFRTTKCKAPPSIIGYNPIGAGGSIRNLATGTDWTSVTFSRIGAKGFSITGATPAGSTAGQSNVFHWLALARLS